MSEDNEKLCTINLKIPCDLKDKFKAYTSLDKSTMRDKLLVMIEEYVKEKEG